MSATAFAYETYQTGDGTEHFLTFGDSTGQQLLLIAPLFEELNFTRRFCAEIGRRLAAQGIGVWIPDLPGSGESLRALATVRWAEWQDAVAAAARHVANETGRLPHVASIRGGALLDGAPEAASRWRFAPASGADLLRQMRRAQSITDKEVGHPPATPAGTISLVGYRLSERMAAALQEAVPDADDRVRTIPAGSAPLWRRAEPSHDPALAATLADDLSAWIASCAG